MMKGIPASAGVGVGRAVVLVEREVPPEPDPGSGACQTRMREEERQRFLQGREAALAYYRELTENVRATAGDDEAAIFEGHLEILGSEDLEEGVEELLSARIRPAEAAVHAFCEATAREFEELESEYFRQRASDIRDIGRRLAEAIHFGEIAGSTDLVEESVIIADELSPSATARLDLGKVAALVTVKGGRTSHAAILARSLAIPCVTGVSGLLSRIKGHELVAVDGDRGEVWTALDEHRDRQILHDFRSRAAASRRFVEHRRLWSKEHPAATADGRAVMLSANVGSIAEAEAAREIGAEGSGLVRSEFFFMRCTGYPSRDDQRVEYGGICEALSPHGVTIRLLDCGADKPLPYAGQKAEDNPYLGERGIRFLMERPEQLHAQVAAIADCADEGHPVKLMIPMVISPGEVRTVREQVQGDLQIGIMVETPASVLALHHLLPLVDFVSIGTNDLTQYILAVDRGNAGVARLYQEFHPAVLAAINQVVVQSHAAGVSVSVCGDMASRPDSAIALLALGVDQLSSGIDAIPEIKATIAQVSSHQLQALTEKLLGASEAAVAAAHAAELTAAVQWPWE
ncbi:phosphoenolpyruvate--protein phosphotransferase [Alkalispirochaeta americana]|uniref:Phosphoenolpyruvate-protein phosphotransferase n=1 Tax=Alkalispirochaeta americana TaxID=159291 RepID=A0A1N6Q7T5_9SPIO|nr:phosphoenolpyruvate--protein phosphotransferase [Alkalispirochaeta americana]SIQ12562.1 phosphoenolpyruvate--protein phosphotransferase [Alkalispirochaeta americana]